MKEPLTDAEVEARRRALQMTDAEVDASLLASWTESTKRRRALGYAWHTTRWELFCWVLADAWAFIWRPFGRKP